MSDKTNSKKGNIKLWEFLYGLYIFLGVLLILSLLSCISEQEQDKYDRTHAYCESCYEEMHIDSLIAYANGNGYICASCLHKYRDEYSLCEMCGYVIYIEDAYLNSYCDNCAPD